MTAGGKVRLIEPQGRPRRPFNAWIGRWPLLGPITLASILAERGYDARVYNENISGPLPDNADAYADVLGADVIGISIMTPTAARGYELADQLRRDGSRARIVFGGVHATFMPEEALAHSDLVVCGEGESVIEDIASGQIRAGIVRAQPLENLDDLPTLNHELMIDFDKLLSRCRRRELYELPVMSSRGCPHGCTYCSVTRMFGRKVRRQSVDKVYADVRRHRERGFRKLFFYDDNLTSDHVWTNELLGRIEPLHLRFNAQTRADFHWLDGARRCLDRELLARMNRAGADVLYIGYETIDDQTAADWSKGYRGANPLRQRLSEDTRILHENGFWIHAMFVLGPQHTRTTAEQIVSFARGNKIETIQISVLTPFPGTPLFEEMRPDLVFTNFPDDWDYYDGTHCVYSSSRMGIRGLQNTLLEAHQKFYRWAGFNWNRIRAIVGGERAGLADKLALLRANTRIARNTMRQWREDTRLFLELVRAKYPQYL